ncbi:hypothetical protein ACLECU_10005 [Lonsdalea quercina]
MCLADARAKASEAKVMINADGDPAAEKRKSKFRERRMQIDLNSQL